MWQTAPGFRTAIIFCSPEVVCVVNGSRGSCALDGSPGSCGFRALEARERVGDSLANKLHWSTPGCPVPDEAAGGLQ